jgi:hypothetical protein
MSRRSSIKQPDRSSNCDGLPRKRGTAEQKAASIKGEWEIMGSAMRKQLICSIGVAPLALMSGIAHAQATTEQPQASAGAALHGQDVHRCFL